jgi:hypothetical protein
MEIRLLAFGGMLQQLSPSHLRPQEGAVSCRELINIRPDFLPRLVPREVLRYHYEDSSANTAWPYRKAAAITP